MKSIKSRVALLFCLLFALTAAQCSRGIKPDLAMAAVEGGDYTVLIEGCGNQVISGFTYCRMTEGDASSQVLTLIIPPAVCAQEACVFFKVFYPDSNISYGGSIPRGQTRVSIPWKDLIKKEKFEVGDRGIWGVRVEAHWVDTDGRERISVADGEIRMRVLRKEYQSLLNVKDDPNFVWDWTDNGRLIKATTGMRVYLEGRK